MAEKTVPMADRHLLGSIARGDVNALRTLCERHSTSVYALAFAILITIGQVVAYTGGMRPALDYEASRRPRLTPSPIVPRATPG